MTVLVAYGTTGGSTAEIAGWSAEELSATGLDGRLLAAGAVDDVAGYDALALGAAMYASGWHADARKFAKRFAGRFAGRPVWLFSSGPLDHTADVMATATGLPIDRGIRAIRPCLDRMLRRHGSGRESRRSRHACVLSSRG